uniref:Uncharacterized protein n=1 Tax=Oryza meridionalis TaxID=40149 RepID=A0A0E0CSA9_9ORYZ
MENTYQAYAECLEQRKTAKLQKGFEEIVSDSVLHLSVDSSRGNDMANSADLSWSVHVEQHLPFSFQGMPELAGPSFRQCTGSSQMVRTIT